MAKLLMLKGLPASGKSTYAKTLTETGNWVRVNRDLLRTMLHFDKWSGRNENATVTVEIDAVKSLLIRNHSNVVVDDCNLNPKNRDMWAGVAKEVGAIFETKTIDTPVHECLLRDGARPNAVGNTVIVGMALQYGLYPKPEQGFVICDLDGTLCDLTHRLKYLEGEKKDWSGFFGALGADSMRQEVADMLEKHISEGSQIFFVSGRPDNYREATETWLHEHFTIPPHTALFMRSSGDKRPDTEVKAEIFDRYFKQYPVKLVIDDRPSVIRMWREKGLEVVDVGNGVEF